MNWKCPVCGEALYREERSYRCARRHCYDIAKSGYVNLLPPSPGGKRHGDDRLMVQARTDFLSRGFYAHLMDETAEMCGALAPNGVRLLDAGCGEGAYTRRIYDRLCALEKQPQVVGVDISTDALRHAARLVPEASFCAASTAHIPLEDASVDLIVNIFSPFMDAEFRRVLSPGGHLLRVVPLARHLWELKTAVYATPYENPPLPLEAEGFVIVEQRELRREIELPTAQDVQALFQMTPYYYKTGVDDQKKLERVQSLRVTTQFGLIVYQKA